MKKKRDMKEKGRERERVEVEEVEVAFSINSTSKKLSTTPFILCSIYVLFGFLLRDVHARSAGEESERELSVVGWLSRLR